MDIEELYAKPTVQVAFGLTDLLLIGGVGLFFLEGTARYVVLAFAVFSAIATPLFLRWQFSQSEVRSEPGAEGEI